MVSFSEFLDLPTEEIAGLVRASGPQVCGFPINGTSAMVLVGIREW